MRPPATRRERELELELRTEAAKIRRPGQRRRPGKPTAEPGVREVDGRRLYSADWL